MVGRATLHVHSACPDRCYDWPMCSVLSRSLPCDGCAHPPMIPPRGLHPITRHHFYRHHQRKKKITAAGPMSPRAASSMGQGAQVHKAAMLASSCSAHPPPSCVRGVHVRRRSPHQITALHLPSVRPLQLNMSPTLASSMGNGPRLMAALSGKRVGGVSATSPHGVTPQLVAP